MYHMADAFRVDEAVDLGMFAGLCIHLYASRTFSPLQKETPSLVSS